MAIEALPRSALKLDAESSWPTDFRYDEDMNRDQKRLQREIARRQRRKEIGREKAEAGFSESTAPKDIDRGRVASPDQNNASNLLANRPETRRTLKIFRKKSDDRNRQISDVRRQLEKRSKNNAVARGACSFEPSGATPVRLCCDPRFRTLWLCFILREA